MEALGEESPPDRARLTAGPLRIVADDDLQRSRLTVLLRLLLALPHFVFLSLWGLLMVVVAVVNWFAVILTAKPVAEDLSERFLRYYAHVVSYLALGANPFPGFGGRSGSYPVDLELAESAEQNRWSALFRLPLAVPALLLASVLGSFGAYYVSEGANAQAQVQFGVIAVAAVLGWFASLALGRMAQGLRDLVIYATGYLTQTIAYLLLVSDRYPDSDPLAPRYPEAAPEHPVEIAITDDLRRSRLTVFFRLLLWLPHMVWLVLWGFAIFVVVILNWFFALAAGRPAEPLHRFSASYVRYATHAIAFLYLIGNPFPGFAGVPGSYPIDLTLPRGSRQSRWKTAFRLILAIPAGMVAGAIGNAMLLVAVFGWFTGLFIGRMPQGLRNLGAFGLRYNAQLWSYLLLLTDRYPFSGPSQELMPERDPASEPLAAPQLG